MIDRIRTVLGAILLSCVGCGTADRDAPRFAVRGQVTLDGQPLAAAVIAFHCGTGEDEVIELKSRW